MLLLLLIVFSAIGLCGMTFLFPLLGAIVVKLYEIANRQLEFLRARSPTALMFSSHLPRSAMSVSVLIPAHNEGAVLKQSLDDIMAAVSESREKYGIVIRVCVGADGCSDNTVEVAKSVGAEVLQSQGWLGKWQMILALAEHCKSSEWFVLADADVCWPKDFFSKLLPHFDKGGLMAVAPSFDKPGGGVVERFMWWLERCLKSLEGYSGGPISVHGATVCYRSKEFLEAIGKLREQDWLNDDIVFPLSLRGIFPRSKILYLPEVLVHEIPRPNSQASEFKCRRRIARGNIDWIKRLWVPLWRQNPIAALLASRRIFRLFWAYWAVFSFAAGALWVLLYGLDTHVLIFACLLAGGATILTTSDPGRRLLASAAASLLVPYFYFNLSFDSTATVQSWN